MPVLPSVTASSIYAGISQRNALATTTLFQAPTASSSVASHSKAPLPVGAIAGGVVGGALLALLIAAGWLWWGKSIKHTEAKQQREAAALHRTKRNTLQNARISTPRAHSYRPVFTRPPEKKVKFASDASESATEKNTPKADVPPAREPAILAKSTPVIYPKRARDEKSMTGTSGRSASAWSARSPPTTTKGIPRKPSTIDSVSVYSTASGEEHQVRAPTNLILAALGNIGSTMDAAFNRTSYTGGDRHSSSSAWSFIPRNNQGVVRHSQASTEIDVPVGTAL
ncbi:hypothetical protein BDQ12DRAFT_732442 [Crucibulum laeve]|uniref:Transmembrane protein n=1 Tax=Crucibulum laeve TaxID=68775 RepID=A0A5C3MBY4_9AGAR|nr:hypothetical protein BDQ12DRAFT_732442 [Crucibulum laeve]